MKRFLSLLFIVASISFCKRSTSSKKPGDQTIVFITGDDEYHSREVMKPFAEKLKKDYGFNVIYIEDKAPGADKAKNHDPQPTELPNAEKIKNADLLVCFIRFRNWKEKSMKYFMDYFKAGKPAIGIRTTTHAFWKDHTFAPKYFGGNYKTHYQSRIVAQVNPKYANHPIVRGVKRKWGKGEGPYVSTPLAEGAVPVVFSYGHNRDRKDSPGIGNDSFDGPNYPVAWAFHYKGGRRAMITLGSYRVGDLKASYFKKLFYNSVFWALGLKVPRNGVLAEGKDYKPILETSSYKPEKIHAPSPPKYTPPGKNWEMLFNGKDLLKWKHYDLTIPPYGLYIDHRAATKGPIDYSMSPARWNIEDSTVIARPGYGDIITREDFSDYKLHLNFYIPKEPKWVTGEWRGNSGVYLNGSYEIAILDSYSQKPTDRTNGAFYRFRAPDMEASKPAGEWQSLDVTFNKGKATVILNGKVIQKSVKLDRPTFMGFPASDSFPKRSFQTHFGVVSEGPIRLQAETSYVRFANIAIKRLTNNIGE